MAYSDDCHYHILADQKGRPIAIRYQGPRRRSFWLVKFDTWFDKDFPGCLEALQIIENVTDWLGVGTRPTPSSLGRETMRYMYTTHNLQRHTCLPVACEEYIHAHGFGGISQSYFIGETIEEVTQNDKSFAYVSVWDHHPDGTPLWVNSDEIWDFPVWFGECKVTLKHELPVGLFAIRSNNRIYHPKLPGVYRTHLWKEHVEDLLERGIDVRVIKGWAWPTFTDDNTEWKEWVYNKRIRSPSKDVERMVKKVVVSAIGSFNRSRDVFTMVGPSRYDAETDYPVLYQSTPLNLWVHPERDSRSALMSHWTTYSIDRTNAHVLHLAYPFSVQNSLVLLETDAFFTKTLSRGNATYSRGNTGDNRVLSEFAKKGSVVPQLGQWLWKTHHNFKLWRPRMWTSDEEPARYGSLLRRIV